MAITQSQSVKKLLLAQNLVRKVESIEKLAYMDQILLDQSTLIKNELAVVGFWNDKYNPIEKYSKLNFLQNLSPQLQESLEQAMFLNNTISNESDSGNAADMALFKFSEKWNYNFKEIQDQKDFAIIRIPFDSTRKRNTSVINNKRVVVRGALELILSFSTKYQSLSNGLCDLTEDLKEQIQQQYNSAHRTQALAYRDLIGDINCQQLINNASFDQDKKELIFIGFISLTYPVKNGAQSVINQIKQAGIGVKLITGNQIAFAQEVAKECGIFTEGAICKNGCDFVQDFHNKNYDIEDLTVLARSRPEDNLALLTELQKIGHVVGVYGDGTNDGKQQFQCSPSALMKADVGFCGGMNSTEIARECSGIILLDDNIRSILSGIMFGRNLVESLKQFLQYSIITINSLLIIQIVYSITNSEVFSIFQLLWISLIIEILASIVIVQSFDLQQRLIQKPNMKGELKINKFMIGNIIILIIYTILTTLLISNSIIHGFNSFIFITIFNIISSSKLHFEINVFKGLSWIAGSILLGIFGLQIIIIELGDTVMKTSGGLTIIEWVTSFIVGLGSIIVRGLMIIVIRFLLSSFKINEESYD